MRFCLKILTKNRRQIRPDGTQMSNKSWFGGVLGRCLGVLEPSGPANPPRCILGCENHVRGSPLGDAFWYNSCCFLCVFFVVFSSLLAEWYFIDFYAVFKTFSAPFLKFFGARWKYCSLFCYPSKQNHDFQGSRASIFQYFFQSFPHSIPDLIFLVFLVILGSPRLPFSSFWA